MERHACIHLVQRFITERTCCIYMALKDYISIYSRVKGWWICLNFFLALRKWLSFPLQNSSDSWGVLELANSPSINGKRRTSQRATFLIGMYLWSRSIEGKQKFQNIWGITIGNLNTSLFSLISSSVHGE